MSDVNPRAMSPRQIVNCHHSQSLHVLCLAFALISFSAQHLIARRNIKIGRSSPQTKRLLTFNNLLIWGQILPAQCTREARDYIEAATAAFGLAGTRQAFTDDAHGAKFTS